MNRVRQMFIILITILSLLGLTACGSKIFVCDICNKEKSGKSYKSQPMGYEITICEDCYKSMNDFMGN